MMTHALRQKRRDRLAARADVSPRPSAGASRERNGMADPGSWLLVHRLFSLHLPFPPGAGK